MIVNGIGEEVEPVEKDGSGVKETCCICHGDFLDGQQHIPSPVKNKGMCCSPCNWLTVMPARMGMKDQSKQYPYKNPNERFRHLPDYYQHQTPSEQSMLKWLQNYYPKDGKFANHDDARSA